MWYKKDVIYKPWFVNSKQIYKTLMIKANQNRNDATMKVRERYTTDRGNERKTQEQEL